MNRRRTIALCVLLAVLATGLYVHMRGLGTRQAWSVFPGAYSGDNIQILAWLKAASEGTFLPIIGHDNPRLGFPTGSNWNDFPQYHQLLICAFGQLSRAVNVVSVAHLTMLVACVTSCLGFFLACRLMRWHAGLALGLSLAFGFSYFGCCKGAGHVWLTFVGIVPLGIVVSWWLWKDRKLLGSRLWIALAVGAWFGQGDTYSLGMWGLMLCAVVFTKLASRKPPWSAALVFAATVASFFMFHSATFVTAAHRGYNKDVNPIKPWHVEMFALKPAELLIPPATHRWSAVHKLTAWNDHRTEGVLVRGEMHAPYLGAVGIAGLLAMFVACAWRVARRKPCSCYLVQALIVFAFAVLGGGNFIAGMLGANLLRATARYSCWIHALSLLFLVSLLVRWTRNWDGILRWALGLGLGLFSVWDCYLPFTGGAEIDQRRIANDRAFGRELDKAIAKDAGVFVLPAEKFPDAVSLHNLRPYLWSTHGRFTSGQVFGRPETQWHLKVLRQPFTNALAELKQHGFVGFLFIGQQGPPIQGGRVMTDSLNEQHLILFQ